MIKRYKQPRFKSLSQNPHGGCQRPRKLALPGGFGTCGKLQRGLSLIEVAISTMLVGVLLVSSLDSLGAVIHGRTQTMSAGKGLVLAEQLMTEILNTDFEDGGGSPIFGAEPGEATGNRAEFDDVDDFDSWFAAPPQYANGDPIFDEDRWGSWRREVTVELVDPTSLMPETVPGTDQGLKRITVLVLLLQNNDYEVVARLVGLRSDQYTTP